MDYKDFEKHIQDTFRDRREKSNHDALLASLGLEEKKDEKNYFMWGFLVLGLLTILGVSSYVYTQNDFSSITASNHDYQNSPEASTIIGTNKDELNDSTVDYERLNEKETNPSDSKDNLENPIKNLTEVKKDIPSIISPSKVYRKKERISSERNINEKTVLMYSDRSIDSATEIKSDIIGDNVKPLGVDKITKDKAVSTDSKTLGENRLENVELLVTKEALIETNRSFPSVAKQKIVCPTFKDKQYWMEFGLEGGVGALNQKLSSDGDLTFINQYRIDHEEGIEDINVKAFVALQSKKLPLGGKVGISLSRYANRLSYDDEYTQRDTTVGIISTTVSTQGDTITHIYGDIVTETTYKLKQKKHYYIYRLDIPVSALYTYYFNRNAVQLELGAMLNIRTWSEGSVLSEDPTGILPRTFIPINDRNMIKKNVGVSFFGQINFLRNLNNGISVYAAPYFALSPSTYSTGNEVAQKFWSGGMKVGMMKAF